MDKRLLEQLCQTFDLDSDKPFTPIGEGHINQTWLAHKDGRKLILQQVNTYVFNRPKILMNNFAHVASHLASKKAQRGYPYEVLHLEPTVDGQLYFEDEEHGLWRAMTFIDNSVTLQTVSSATQARVIAEAFGHFNCALLDLPASELGDVIPNFHCLDARYQQLNEAAMHSERLALGEAELIRAKKYEFILEEFEALQKRGLAKRIVHNDTKVNNILLNQQQDKALCVIDLDTVMPGYLMYDFGDMVRTIVSPEKEDSANTAGVTLRLEMYEALLAGYSKAIGDVMTPLEKESLLLGAKLLPLIIGIRFLADYLRKDTYFGAQYPTHNLVRAQNQFALLDDILAKEDALKRLSEQYLS